MCGKSLGKWLDSRQQSGRWVKWANGWANGWNQGAVGQVGQTCGSINYQTIDNTCVMVFVYFFCVNFYFFYTNICVCVYIYIS